MILSVHIGEGSKARAMRAYNAAPLPGRVHGLQYARTFLTAGLRAGVMPSLNVTGMLMLMAWDDDEGLDRFMDNPLMEPYADGWHVRMRPMRAIGELPGLPALPRREEPLGDSPVAALTVGRVRADKFLPFIKAAGDAEREAGRHPGFLNGLTILRPPLVIGTFSVWRNVKDMRQYVVGKYPGGHSRAMAKDRELGFNYEMFFSRHLPYAAAGRWGGRNPLAIPEFANGRAHQTE